MRPIKVICLVILFGSVLLSCTSKKSDAPAPAANVAAQVVEVTAVYDPQNNRHLFRTDADTILSGWTTFHFTNASPMTHFMVLEHMPDGRTSEDTKRDIFPPFQEAMNLILTGKQKEGMAKLGELPPWFSQVVFSGGPGLTSPGHSTETTVKVAPGNYVLECYVKNTEGQFHSALGMIRDLRVTEDSMGVAPPTDPSLVINLSNEGFEVQGEPTPGAHLVAVHFNEEKPPLLGNDVHLAKLAASADIDSVAAWLDWSQPMGLVSSAEHPAPATFLGGTQELPRGNTSYFTVELTPGRYAWISERPASASMYKEFTVSQAAGM